MAITHSRHKYLRPVVFSKSKQEQNIMDAIAVVSAVKYLMDVWFTKGNLDVESNAKSKVRITRIRRRI